MNKVDVLSRDIAEGRRPAMPREQRSPPKAAILLLPVWGYSYVRQFLECGLPTLLAPGNVPALRCRPADRVRYTDQRRRRTLISANTVLSNDWAPSVRPTVHPIDHLITDTNYSTTITLAYAEAVRDVGEAMLDTCFFFLVSDYVVADGSFANALKRMQHGISAIVVGNLQTTARNGIAVVAGETGRQ